PQDDSGGAHDDTRSAHDDSRSPSPQHWGEGRGRGPSHPGDTSTTVLVDFGNSGGRGRPIFRARSSMNGLNLPEEPVEIASRLVFTRFGIERLPSIVSSFML